jgi:two-component system, LytTR family, response regulator
MGIKYKCLIVDDEKQAHQVLKSHISNCEELEWSADAYNGKEAIQILSQQKFDIVFLDIEMPLLNGIEVMQTLPNRPATIITTAYTNFAFDAYQNDAVDYLLKPISFPKFLKSIEKAKNNYVPKTANNYNVLKLKSEGIYKELKIDEVRYIQSFGNYLKIFITSKNQPIVVYNSLKNFINSSSSKFFVQTHKSFIINVNYLETVGNDFVVIKGNIKIPLGRKFGSLP